MPSPHHDRSPAAVTGSDAAHAGEGAWPDWTRAAASVALAVYLVGLGLTLVGNTGSGSSALVRTIHGRLFAPWMVPPWLDLGFDYRLVPRGEDDGDHAIEVVSQEKPRGPAVRLPGGPDGERAQRWRRLARAIAADGGDADRDGLLAAAVGQGVFEEVGTDDVVVRVMRIAPRARGVPPAAATTAFSARVRVVDGELQLVRSAPAGEVAPLVRAKPTEPRGQREATP